MADEISFDWDQANVAHIRRHRVTPEEVEQALRNDPVEMDYAIADGEERWTSIGHTNSLRVLSVIWTLRGEAMRVITARQTAKTARLAYLRSKGLMQ